MKKLDIFRPLGYPHLSIEENVLTETRNAVNEEWGISDDIAFVSKNLADFIRKYKGQMSVVQMLGHYGCVVRRAVFGYAVFGDKISVDVQFVSYGTEEDFKKYNGRISQIGNGFSLYKDGSMTLSLDAYDIGGKIDPRKLEDTIQHELHHYYQQKVIPKGHRKDDLYIYAIRLKRDGATVAQRMLGDALYISSQREIEAFCNGLYSLLRTEYEENPTSSKVRILYESDAIGAYRQLSKYIEFFEENLNNDEVCDALLELRLRTGMTPPRFLKFIKRGKSVFIRNIGRAVVKAQKDCGITNNVIFRTED